MRLGFDEPFPLPPAARWPARRWATPIPSSAPRARASEATVRAEEEKFLATVATGAHGAGGGSRGQAGGLPGRCRARRCFRLYDTYGLYPSSSCARSPRRRSRDRRDRLRTASAGAARALARRRRGAQAPEGGASGVARQGARGQPVTRFEGYERPFHRGVRVLAARGLSRSDGVGRESGRGRW